MSRRRALTGTREGYTRCARCPHSKLAHITHGTGACTRGEVVHETDEQGRNVARFVRCTCPYFATDQELI